MPIFSSSWRSNARTSRLAEAGWVWNSRSISAEETNSTVAKPWLNLRAAMKRCNRSAGRILHLPDPDVRMPDRNILALAEGDAEQAGGAVEGGVDHVVEHEIRLDRGVVEIGAALPQLFGVVAPVPRRQREIAALLRDQRLQGIAIGQCAGPRRLPDPLQQAAHGLRGLGHRILQPEGGEGRKAQELGAFLA